MGEVKELVSRADVLEIRRLAEMGASRIGLAKRYGICKQHVFDILKRKKWASV